MKTVIMKHVSSKERMDKVIGIFFMEYILLICTKKFIDVFACRLNNTWQEVEVLVLPLEEITHHRLKLYSV